MKKINLILVLFVLIIQSCNDDDECNQLCFTPPQTFEFEIVDKESGKIYLQTEHLTQMILR